MLTGLLCVAGEANRDEMKWMADLVTDPATEEWSRNLGLAGLMMLGPKAKFVMEPLAELLSSSSANLDGEFNFASLVQANSQTQRYLTGRFFLPQHLERTPLLRGNNWGRREGTHRDALITLIGCMGESQEATELLWSELSDLKEKHKITWISPDFHPLTSLTYDMRRDCLVHALTSTAPDEFPTEEAVWVELLGEKRLPVAIEEQRPLPIQPRVLDELQQRLLTATADVPLRYAADGGYPGDYFDDRLDGLHGAVESWRGFGDVNHRLAFFPRYRIPVAHVRVGDAIADGRQEGSTDRP